MEDCHPFVRISRMLIDAGVQAPEVFAGDLARGFLLLTDFGDQTYLAVLDAATAPQLYSDAIDALILWQQASREGELRPYDEALLMRELSLFPDWYVARHLGRSVTVEQARTLADAFRLVLDNNLAQPCVFVHRDYHSRNLMATTPNPGVLDFQDAVYGPITYDLVSLLRDAYIDWDEERRDRLGRALLGACAARKSARRRRLRRVLARFRMDGRATPVEGARHLRAALSPTANETTSITCRG